MQCEEKNQLARGGAGARERAYKVACAVPIRKFSEAGNGRRKGKDCKSLSEERKEVGQNSQEYLDVKDGRKIGILNGACLEENLSNQMPTSIGMVGNKSVTVLRDTGCSGVILKRELVAEEHQSSESHHHRIEFRLPQLLEEILRSLHWLRIRNPHFI